MNGISSEQFQLYLKRAALICSPGLGYLVITDKRNPYKNLPFEVPEDATFELKETMKGDFITMKVKEEVVLAGFITKK